MPDAWPVVARLNPNIAGLDTAVSTFPKYDEFPDEQEANVAAGSVTLMDTAWLVLNGGETQDMRFSESYDPAVLSDRLQGPEYKISSHLLLGDRDVLAQLGQIAGSALAVRAFADHFNSIEYGKVNQALAGAFRELYRQYLESLVELQAAKLVTLYQIYVHLQPFAVHLNNARELISRFKGASRRARERKRIDGATDLVERASTSQFVSHDDRETVITLRGGAVLRCLGELMHREMGDSVVLNLYEELLRAASVPYLEMLKLWITEGRLRDPFEEFMVQETRADAGSGTELDSHLKITHESLDDYWDKRYTVRAMDVPLQLGSERIYNMLLVSGKYINVLRDQDEDCGSALVPLDRAKQLLDDCETIEDPRVIDAVSTAYKAANSAVMSLLKQRNLRGLLHKLNEVFFLQSDLTSKFLAAANPHLQLRASRVSPTELERVFAQLKDPEDPWSQFITVNLAEQSLPDTLLTVVTGEQIDDGPLVDYSKLSGIDVAQFDFDVPFPLSLIVSRRAIVRYQFLFRHLVELVIAREASGVSYLMQSKPVPIQFQFRPISTRPDEKKYLDQPRHWWWRTGLLRQRQALFIDFLLAQSTYEGILPEFSQFEKLMDQASEISEITKLLLRFLDRGLIASLLSDSIIIRHQSRLISLCHQFRNFVESNDEIIQYFTDLRVDTLYTAEGEEVSREGALGWYAVLFEKHESSFDRNLKRFIDRLEALVPTDFVAGGSMQLLLRQLEPLRQKEWDKYTE